MVDQAFIDKFKKIDSMGQNENPANVGPTVYNATRQNEIRDMLGGISTQGLSTGAPALAPAKSPLASATPATTPAATSVETPEDALAAAIKKQDEAEKRVQENQQAIQKNIDEGEARKSKIEAETSADIGKIELKRGMLVPPKYKEVPYQKPAATSPIEQWGSAAMIFAMLASAFTRRPMVTAMNAAAAAINGFNQKDQAVAKQAYEEWKIASDNAVRAFEFERKAYEDALKGYDTEEKLIQLRGTQKEKEIDAHIKALNAAFHNDSAEQIRLSSGVSGVARLIEAQDKSAKSLDLRAKQIEASVAEANARTQKLQAEAKMKEQVKGLMVNPDFINASPKDRAIMLSATTGDPKFAANYNLAETRLNKGGKVGDDEVDAIAEALASFNYPIPTAKQLQSDPNLRKAMEKANALNPGFTSSGPARQRSYNDIESGITSRNILALNTVDFHADEFAKALQNKPKTGDVAALNKWAAGVNRFFNLPAQTAYDATGEVYANEFVRALQNGGAAGALADRQRIISLVGNALSEGSGEKLVEQMKKLTMDRRVAIADEKGRFFTPEQVFGDRKGAEVRQYADENRGGLETYGSMAYTLPGKSRKELKKTIYPEGSPELQQKDADPNATESPEDAEKTRKTLYQTIGKPAPAGTVESATPSATPAAPAAAPAAKPEKFSVGDSVTRTVGDKTYTYRVTAVDENGKITAADPVQ